MANLPKETVTIVFKLQQRLWELINETTAADWAILEEYGETEATVSALDALQNARERLRTSFSRLYTLMLQVAESQPAASSATLNLLNATIEQSEAIMAAVEASIREAKRDFNLP